MRSAADIIEELRSHADADNVAGMARYGISTRGTLGVQMPLLRGIARDLRPERRSDPEEAHRLAGELWDSGVHEARILAALVDVPELVTPQQADAWARDLDSWDVCDQLCGNLLDRTAFAYDIARRWAGEEPPYVKRAGFVLMAQLAVHDKAAPDAPFVRFLALAEREGDDDRPPVSKGIDWALRQIGKRDRALWSESVATAERMRAAGGRASRRVAANVLRELRSPAVRDRLGIG